MPSTYTPNIGLELVARGDFVGTWDTPTNSNWSVTDLVVGGLTTINAAAGSVVLGAAQFQCETIVINSTLLASITLTFPTSFTKQYTIYHNATGSSAFTITLGTTSASGNVLCAIPGEYIDVINLGSAGIVYKNLGRVGSYVDIATSSMPNWVTGCTLPPYLNANGTTFSSASYPQLATILGSTTLPDFRGRNGYFLNEGTGRLTTAGAGIDGNTRFATGGTNGVTLGASQIPTITSTNSAQTITLPGYLSFTSNVQATVPVPSTGGLYSIYAPSGGADWLLNRTSIVSGIQTTYTNSSQAIVGVPAPGIVSGIRMIRAA